MMNEINLKITLIKEELVIVIDDKKYHWQDPSRWYSDYAGTAPEGNRNHFTTGSRNIFLWEEGKDFGYKIFTKGRGKGRRINRILYTEKFNWVLLEKKQIERLHNLHNDLNKITGRVPKSFNMINFNEGEFYGLKVQRIKGERSPAKKNAPLYEPMRVALRQAGSTANGLMCDLKSPGNFIIDPESNSPYLVDIEFNHIR